jgi:hypothetical protein
VVIKMLYPDMTKAEASDIIVPHHAASGHTNPVPATGIGELP